MRDPSDTDPGDIWFALQLEAGDDLELRGTVECVRGAGRRRFDSGAELLELIRRGRADARGAGDDASGSAAPRRFDRTDSPNQETT